MFVAMNTFKVNPERCGDFEDGWRSRESYLAGFKGFVQFALLKGDEPGDYISHSTWESRADFMAWTESEAFKAAHGRRSMQGVLMGPPQVRFYESVIVERTPAPAS